MGYERLYILPIIIFILFPSTFLSTYIAAVLLGHVEPDFPYISDTGTYSPESCVFGQLMNIGTVLLGVVMYIRYKQVGEYHRTYTFSSLVERLNNISMGMGILSCLGLSIVANFQETNMLYVHLTGAFMCFGLGTVYAWMQAVSSYHMHPLVNSLYMAHWRVGLSMVSTMAFISLSVTGVLSHLQFHGTNPTKWYPEDGGWELHVVSTASEWIVAACFCFFILSYVNEFQKISFEPPRVYLTVERLPCQNANIPSIEPADLGQEDVDVLVRRGSIIT